MSLRIWTRDEGPSPGAFRSRSCTRLPISNRKLLRVVRSVVLVVLALPSGAAPAIAKPHPSKSLTVERIYGGPSLSGHLIQGIEWTPDSKRISYLQRDGSSVEMWTMDAAKGERKVLVKAGGLE